MTLAQLKPYYGFTRLPFFRQIPASALFRSQAQQEALARIAFVIEHGGARAPGRRGRLGLRSCPGATEGLGASSPSARRERLVTSVGNTLVRRGGVIKRLGRRLRELLGAAFLVARADRSEG